MTEDDWLKQRTAIVRAPHAPQQLTFTRFELSVMEGVDTGLTKIFGQESVQIGTARANDFVLSDRTVSRFHAKIETQEGRFRLTDLGSTNGTYLGGYGVQAAFLESRAIFDLGTTKIRFQPLEDKATVVLPDTDRLGPLIGQSSKMRQLFALIKRVASSDLPVIIEGETGTGKDLVARILHEMSPRVDAPFEVLDCAAIPDNLIESELFGHMRGSFTSAERDHKGLFERANGGTVFLDELGELKVELQPKLLRVLETGQIRPVGSANSVQVDVRVIAATHKSLRELVNKNMFREDLYYRLAGCKIDLPPLRDRREDIPILVDSFLESMRKAGQQGVPKNLDSDTMDQFLQHPWPGNVRQLRNAVERIAVMGTTGFSLEFGDRDQAALPTELKPLKDAKDEFERQYLVRLLERHQGDMRAAASAAEIHPKSLARLLRRYAINRS